MARYDFAYGPGLWSVQWDTEYTSKQCFSVLCAPIEEEPAHTISNARIGYQPPDKKWELSWSLQNIFGEVYRIYTYDASPFAGQIPSVYGKPQNWMVTLSTHW